MTTQDSFCEISQDAHIYVTEHSDHDAKINRPDLSDSGGNPDDGQESANVSNDDDDDDGGGDDSDEDDGNED
jgi:hypothetical protein